MKLELKNINKIKRASIELNGLTVIAGANDSGKSTVGKVLFSVIKALISGLNDSEEQKDETINERATLLIRRLRAAININDQANSSLLREKFPQSFSFVREMKNTRNIPEFFSEREKWIASLDITPRQKILALKDLNIIKNLFLENTDYSSRLKSEIQSYIESEFLNNICSNGTKESKIKYISDNGFVDADLFENEAKLVVCEESIDNALTDVTYVETPLYINLLNVLSGTTTYRELDRNNMRDRLTPMVPAHIKDMITKLEYSKYFQGTLQNRNTFDIESIIGGNFVYDKQSRNLLWMKDSKSYSPVNVASGIKSFGVIQLLLEAETINENKMLIWDEPENHLHPKWQITFAHLLVRLAKAGIPVVVSSHSPYFIQGIRFFSDKEAISKYVNYYLAEETEDGLAEINEVTDDLNRVFVKLAEPLNEIMNLGRQG